MTTSVQPTQRIYVALRYADPNAAILWLNRVLGFEERVAYRGDDGQVVHAELALHGECIMLGSVKDDENGKSPRTLGGVTSSVYIALDSAAEVDALYERAAAAGADITRAPNDTDYGSHEFGLRDVEGHVWGFGTYRP